MSLVTLFSDKHGFLATDQLVYSAEELSRVENVNDLAASLNVAIAQQKTTSKQSNSDGYAAGFEEGMAQASKAGAEAIQKTLVALKASHDVQLQEQRDSCATLAVDIVRKIAGNVAPDDWLYAQACAAANELVDRHELVLRVPVSHYESIASTANNTAVFTRVVADDQIEPSTCFIDTGAGSIEVKLDVQLQQVLRLLTDDSNNE